MTQAPAPLVLASPRDVARTVAELIANRLRARPRLRLLLPDRETDPGLDAALWAHAVRGDPPVDLAVLGLRADGRLGFDDTGSPAELGELLGARELLMLVTGAEKAPALRAWLRGAPADGLPAELVRAHPRLTLICDEPAAAALGGPPRGDHVCVVLGHRDPGFSHEHRISRESLGRVQRAEWVAQRRPTRAAILTGYTSTGGLSEAEQMRVAWRLPGVPAVLEVAGRNTAGNAACSLPIVLALGGIRDVTVVTSAWHVRAPYMFAPWRRFGLRVRFAADRRGDWPRMLAREARESRAARRERREAFGEVPARASA
jgi:hypothetical protein